MFRKTRRNDGEMRPPLNQCLPFLKVVATHEKKSVQFLCLLVSVLKLIEICLVRAVLNGIGLSQFCKT
jgi:hypothetical protein